MRYKYKNYFPLIKYFFCLFLIITLVFLIALSNNRNIIVASNINTVKAIESSRIIKIETIKEYEENLEYIEITNPEDLTLNINNYIKFKGRLKGYSLKNSLSCDVKSKIINDIYYKDETYDNIRILASSNIFPCGTIIQMSIEDKSTFYGIVLDNYTESSSFNFKLLFENKYIANYVGEYDNINFKLFRWGY